MNDTVTDLIVARARLPEGLTRMLVWSATAHLCGILLVLLASIRAIDDAPRTVMTISLGGAPGPQAGGLTQIGGRQVLAPPPENAVRREETPPAPARPAMTLPNPRQQTRPKPPRSQAEDSRPKPVAAEPQEGNVRVETGARGQGFGLSSGGGGSAGVELDVSDFCCPEYLEQMKALIHRSWEQNHGIGGSATVKFTIRRDGTIDDVSILRSSGFLALDSAAHRAMLRTQQLPPLPLPFPNPTLTIRLRFDYQP